MDDDSAAVYYPRPGPNPSAPVPRLGVHVAHVFPYDNVVAGILLLLVGFTFHFLGQGLSVVNWELATRLGLQESGMPEEYRAYEHAIAVADMSIGWIYGVAGVGLLIDAPWGYRLAWFPGAILLYHAIGFWVWTGNHRRAGHRLATGEAPMRVGWTIANLVTAGLAIMLAWRGSG